MSSSSTYQQIDALVLTFLSLNPSSVENNSADRVETVWICRFFFAGIRVETVICRVLGVCVVPLPRTVIGGQ
jgi:hypothetical protein